MRIIRIIEIGIGCVLLSVFLLCLGGCGNDFNSLQEEVIADSKTDLEWLVGPKQVNYGEAINWISSCKVAGGGWRLPTCRELEVLYENGGKQRHINSAFGSFNSYIWCQVDTSNPSSPWGFDFNLGHERWRSLQLSEPLPQVFGVRPN